MEGERLAAVNGTRHGSACVIASRLVLTSAHVVGPVHAPVTVFRPGWPGTYTGTVVWRGTPGGRDDAALVEVTDPAWSPVTDGQVGWGRLVTHRPGTRCECWGVPDLMQRTGRPIDVQQLTGTINPGDRLVGDRFVVNIGHHPPTGTTPWAGMSGAGVFSERLLIGVVVAEPADRAHAALEAVPAAVLLRDPAFAIVVARHCGAEPPECEAVELRSLADSQARSPKAGPIHSPAGLLAPRRAVVPFHGREEILAKLAAWADGPGPGVWLLHAPGGQGKTRLAHRFGALRAQAGWAVLWLDRDVPKQALSVLADTRVPALVVVDYAEGRSEQLATLAEVLIQRRSPVPVKLLLLARTASAWWQELASASEPVRDLVDLAVVSPLLTLDDGDEARRRSYHEALAAFAAGACRVHGTEPDRWSAAAASLAQRSLEHGCRETVLAVHMTALADLLDAVGEPAQIPGPVLRGPEDRVLDHERGYWRIAARAAGLPQMVTTRVLDDVVAAATLVGPGTARELDELLTCLPAVADLARGWREAVRSWLLALYPMVNGGRFEGLVPDRLAERLVGRLMLDGDGHSVLDTLVESASEELAERIVTVVTRAAAHTVVKAELSEQVCEWCLRHPELLLATVNVAPRVECPAPLLDALTRFAEGAERDEPTLLKLMFAFPRTSNVLADVAATTVAALVDECRGCTAEDGSEAPFLMAALQHLAIRLGHLGRYDEAIDAIDEAIAIFRGLQEEHPHLPQDLLYMALDSLSGQLKDVGRLDEALAVVSESLELQRRRTDFFGPAEDRLSQYAMSLNNFANILGIVGRFEEGMAAMTQAVDILRTLILHDEAAHLPSLAMSLNGLSNLLSQLRRYDEALEAIGESVEIRRRLAGERPDAHLPELAVSLYGCALRLGEVGEFESGLTVVLEAVEIERSLAARRPVVYEPRLAESLNVMAKHLRDLGRPREALLAAEEAIEIESRLAAGGLQSHLSAYAASLANLADVLGDLGEFDDELGARAAEIEIRRQLAGDSPGNFGCELAESLVRLADRQRESGNLAEARVLVEEAILLLDQPAARMSGERESVFALALVCESEVLREAGEFEDALVAIKNATEEFRRLDQRHSGDLSYVVAKSLTTQANVLDDLGRHEEQVPLLSEAADIWRRIDGAHSVELAEVLSILSETLAAVGQLDEALAAASEAGVLWRRVNEEQCGARTFELAASLAFQSVVWSDLGRPEESLASVTQAVGVLRAAGAERERELAAYLAEFLYLRSMRLADLGRTAEAAAAVAESIEVERDRLRADPKPDTSGLDTYVRWSEELLSG